MVHRDSLRYLVARQVVVGRYYDHDVSSFPIGNGDVKCIRPIPSQGKVLGHQIPSLTTHLAVPRRRRPGTRSPLRGYP